RRLGIKWYWRMVWCSVLYLAFAVIPALVFRLALETESREAAGAAMVFAFMVYWVIFPILTIVSIVAFFLCVYHVVHK
ncbi:MAG: hypothetical protein GTN64_07485, partial [Candidatus Latescibacteria bacterium]|nr:hypothetical protein [Candidatus Latescibacterota bacterium]NIO78445.1 hypothetical protein [Candidatus Latescibacterota bacterium]